MAWNERCSQKALGKSLFYYYRKALAAVSLNNWINAHIANASRFDSAVYSSLADKLYSVELILFQVRFFGRRHKQRPDCSLQLLEIPVLVAQRIFPLLCCDRDWQVLHWLWHGH